MSAAEDIRRLWCADCREWVEARPADTLQEEWECYECGSTILCDECGSPWSVDHPDGLDQHRGWKVTPMRFHGPGWTVETESTGYWLWAPQAEIPEGQIGGERRTTWAASWDMPDADAGNYRQHETLQEALTAFANHPDQDECRTVVSALLEAAGQVRP